VEKKDDFHYKGRPLTEDEAESMLVLLRKIAEENEGKKNNENLN
jgi:hypothetical protein